MISSNPCKLYGVERNSLDPALRGVLCPWSGQGTGDNLNADGSHVCIIHFIQYVLRNLGLVQKLTP